MSNALPILFEDNHCIAVAKPAPLLTQAISPEVPNLEAMVKSYLKERYSKPGNVYLGVPHRLDRPVSGVVIFARNTKAARRIAEQFQNHTVTKVYLAVVEGRMGPETGIWEDWMIKLTDQARAELATEKSLGAKKAVMEFRLLKAMPEQTLVEFRPRTGRMHQIRLQASARGWPIWGDELYGSTRTLGPQASTPRERVIALHARSLTLLHPIRFEPMSIVAPLPETWRDIPIDVNAFL